MRQWNLEKIQRQMIEDQTIYGFSAVAAHKRKWWNPMRLLFGRFKVVRVDPKEFLNDFSDAMDM